MIKCDIITVHTLLCEIENVTFIIVSICDLRSGLLINYSDSRMSVYVSTYYMDIEVYKLTL